MVVSDVVSKPIKKRTTKPKKNTQEVVISENIESIVSEVVPELMSEVIHNVSVNVIADNHVGEKLRRTSFSGVSSYSSGFASGILHTTDNGASGADNNTFAILDNIISNTLENNTYDLISQTQTLNINDSLNDNDFEDILAESFVYEGVSYFIDEHNRIFHPQTLLQIGVFQPDTLSVLFI